MSLQDWLVPALVVVILALWARSGIERRPIIHVARKLGLVYRQAHDPLLLQCFAELPIVARGHSHRAIDVLRGSSPAGPLVAFRLICEVGSRRSRRLLQYFVVSVQQDTPIQLLRLGRHRRINRYHPGLPTVDLSTSDTAAYVLASPPDTGHLDAEALRSWLEKQRKESEWQVTPAGTAGYTPYKPEAALIEDLIKATTQLARMSHSPALTIQADLSGTQPPR